MKLLFLLAGTPNGATVGELTERMFSAETAPPPQLRLSPSGVEKWRELQADCEKAIVAKALTRLEEDGLVERVSVDDSELWFASNVHGLV